MTAPAFSRIGPDDLPGVTRLLQQHDLPVSDLEERDVFLLGLRANGRLLGVGGLVPFSRVGLIRSVAVASSHRGKGYGSRLCEGLEREARNRGIDRLFLLTTTAEGFFRRQGFDAVPRDVAPEPIRDTSQFTQLCPSSATLMRTSVGSRDQSA